MFFNSVIWMTVGGGVLEEWCTMILAMWNLLLLLPNNLVISEMYLKMAMFGMGEAEMLRVGRWS
jgi:hypothetical protein